VLLTAAQAASIRSHQESLRPQSSSRTSSSSARVFRKDVADRLRVCTATVYRLCAAGQLPYFRIGAAIRIREQDLAVFGRLD